MCFRVCYGSAVKTVERRLHLVSMVYNEHGREQALLSGVSSLIDKSDEEQTLTTLSCKSVSRIKMK